MPKISDARRDARRAEILDAALRELDEEAGVRCAAAAAAEPAVVGQAHAQSPRDVAAVSASPHVCAAAAQTAPCSAHSSTGIKNN